MVNVVCYFRRRSAGDCSQACGQTVSRQLKERYLSPIEMASSPDGRLLYVVCQDSDEVRVVDVASGKVINSVPVGHMPRGIALSPDGRQLYVTNAWSDTVSVIDAATLTGRADVAHRAGTDRQLLIDRRQQTLYVANRLSGDISVIDLKSGQETKRLLAGRGASYLALSPDGKVDLLHPHLSESRAFRTQPNSEITVIDTCDRSWSNASLLHNVAGVFHVALSADGHLGVAAQLRPKNLIPLAHVEHGWAFGDSLTLFGPDIGWNGYPDSDRRTRSLLRPAVGSHDRARQVENLSDHRGV
jgi:YVTN family beta-propeller protein